MFSDYDDEPYLFDDYYSESDNGWYDEFDEYGHGMCGMDDHDMCGMDSDDMDYEHHFPLREPPDQQAIYKELNIPNPNNVAKTPLPLIDICASKVALNFPFAYIEDRTPPIPENVQLKIISSSFPQHMEKIKQYCSLNNGSSGEFDKAIRIVKSVKDLTQIGFHLSANVECRGYREVLYGGPPGKKSPYLYISIKFDRGKIIETSCPCENASSWCFHVIAVCLARIFLFDKCAVKPPLSDSLNNLTSFAQLRTFTQYLIAEFSDRRIVESAQNVLDRMLKPQAVDSDAINETWGAPDPTAGPGLGETAQWLICEEGLKFRCKALLNNFDLTEGCWSSDVGNLSTSVIERWRLSQIERPLVEDYFNNLENIPGSVLYSYNQYKKTYSRENSQDITKFLKTCEELLRDDFEYSLKAVQGFTVQLVDLIEERNKKSSQRESFYNTYGANNQKFETNFHLGCVPRPQTCWLFRDQLARLWRLLVLNPSISVQERQEIFSTLEKFQTKLRSTKENDKKQYLEWDSQEHIQHLKEFSWGKLQLTEDPFKNVGQISVSSCTLIECGKHPTKADHTEQFPYPVDLTCGEFSSSVTVYCYLVEALSVYGKKEQAVYLAMNVALAIVRFYATWCSNEGRVHVAVKTTVSVVDKEEDSAHNDTVKKNKGAKRKRHNRKRPRAGSKKTEGVNEESANNSEELFDQIKGVIPITCIAFLMDFLKQNQDILAEMLKLVKLTVVGLSHEDMMVFDVVTDAEYLIFCLGVVGVAMPKLQAPSLQTQVEWFNWEVYISDKIMKSTRSSGDVGFLNDMTSRMIHLCQFGGFHPPHALVMNLFQHSYKPGSNELGGQAEHAANIALETIVAASWKPNGVHINRRVFLESMRRHWVKLCETVLCRVSASPTRLRHFSDCLFVATAMIGSTSEDLNFKVNKKTTDTVRNTQLIQSMVIEKIVANIYLAYVLASHADSLETDVTTDLKTGIRKISVKQKLVVGARTRPVSEQRELLYESAIQLASRAFAVKNVAVHQLHIETFDYKLMEFLHRSLRWMCDISSKIGVKAFDMILERQCLEFASVKCFNDDEVIKICTVMLESEQKREDRVWLRVRDALLTLVRPQSQKKIPEILSLCRNVEKESSSKRVLLVPAVCKELLMYIPGSSLETGTKVEHLTRAMLTMQTLIKKLESEDEQQNLDGVKELFSECSTSSTDKPGTSHDSGKHESLDPNLQLCFDLAIETIKHIDDDNHVRGFETRRRFENICNVIVFVATRASKTSGQLSLEAAHKSKSEPFEEVYVSRFIEVLCIHIKDCLLLTDFFFELGSRLLNLPQHGCFGRTRVLLSDDCELAMLCRSCSSLSVLLKRCMAGLIASTHGEMMDGYLKETTQSSAGYIKTRANNAKFYCGASLVSVLEVVKRLMSISEEDDFEPFSYKLSSKHAITKAAIEELSNKTASSPRDEVMISENLISSLLLRRMFSPALACFDYDSDDGWRY